MTQITTQQHSKIEAIVSHYIFSTVSHAVTRQAYGRATRNYLSWLIGQGRGIDRQSLFAYRQTLIDQGYQPATINQTLTGIRHLAKELGYSYRLPASVVDAITSVPDVATSGRRVGNWLNLEETRTLIHSIKGTDTVSKRDRAILAVGVLAALRRSEIAGLTWGHIQKRDGRHIITNLHGKHGRVRSVPLHNLAVAILTEWWNEVNNIGHVHGDDDRIFFSIGRTGTPSGDSISPTAINDIIKARAAEAGFKITSHDLRRTGAKLMHSGGADLAQIQIILGHSSVRVTERYLGLDLEIINAATDCIDL